MRETTDRTDPGLRELQPNGQQAAYLVLSEDERAQGFVRPVRRTYRHLVCGSTTTMALGIAETFARNNTFYTGTFCCHCLSHFPLIDTNGAASFFWVPDGSPVGS